MNTLRNYRQLRTEATNFSLKLFGQLDRIDSNNAGRLLGILHNGKLVFDEEGAGGTDLSHFADFAIFDYCNAKGLNAVQRYWQQYKGQLSKDEDRLLNAFSNAKSSLFSVIEVDQKKSTLKLQDIFDDNNQVEITDISMSKSPLIKDCIIFTRVLAFDYYNMTTGISFVFLKDKEQMLQKKYKSMIKQTVAYTPQAKNYIVFLKLSHKFGVQTEYK